MFAAVFRAPGGPEAVKGGEFPDPRPGPGEVLVRARACGLNHLDLWIIGGSPAYKVPLPHAPGTDIAGEVVQTGSGVEGFTTGQRVLVNPLHSCGKCDRCRAGDGNLCDSRKVIGASNRWGGYAALVVAPAEDLLPMPTGLSFEQAAAIPVAYVTAYRMLTRLAALKSGQTVLVIAAGSGVGSAALDVARHLGATVIATAGSEEKRRKALALGAQAAVDHGRPDFWKAVKDATGGRGVDVVFEHVGGAVFRSAIQALAPGGTLVTCGATAGPEAPLDLRYVFARQLSVKGNYIGTRRELEELCELFTLGRLKPVIDSTFPASEARAALERLSSRAAFGKIVLTHSS